MSEKRKMRSRNEMYPLVEQWQSSGMGKEDFARKHGLAYGTFQYWCSHYRSNVATAEAFVPLHVSEDQHAGSGSVVIVLPSGTRIEVL